MNNNPLVQEIINGRREGLENQDLRGVRLNNINLAGTNLTDTDLRTSFLTGANLTDANLTRASLLHANLRRANLTDANLTGANLRRALLTGADLTGADLTDDANLTEANLTEANLTDANLTGANLTGANLTGADLTGADLTGADLTGADLTDANLREANLTDANLTGANLTGAVLTGAVLTDAIGADLTGIIEEALTNVIHYDPLGVHRESAKINYEKLNTYLKEKLNNINVPANINYVSYLNQTITELINGSDESPEKKAEQRASLQRIMDEKLNGININEFSQNTRNSIYYILEYVKLQPAEFKKKYINDWFETCISDAYGGKDITCAGGVFERLCFALSTACVFLLSSGENPECEMIISIIGRNPEVLVIEYIQDWYKLHKTGTAGAFPDGTTEEQKKASLKQYLLSLLPGSEELIDAKIAEFADNIGYEAADFAFGGRRRNRKTVKRRTNKRNRKTNIRKTNKRRKTVKRKTNRRKNMRR